MPSPRPPHMLLSLCTGLCLHGPPLSSSPFSLNLQRHHHYLRRFFHSHDGYAATIGDGKIVGVSFVDVRSKRSRVASLGLVSSLTPGAGTMTVVAACSHAEKLGFSTLVRYEGGTIQPFIHPTVLHRGQASEVPTTALVQLSVNGDDGCDHHVFTLPRIPCLQFYTYVCFVSCCLLRRGRF